jgi:hypothetical protein
MITLNVTLPLASLSSRSRDSMDCSGDKTFGDLMNNNYLEFNAAPGFYGNRFRDSMDCSED